MKQSLGRRHAAEIDSCQDRREGSIDEGAIYDDVDVVEAVPQDRDACKDRESGKGELSLPIADDVDQLGGKHVCSRQSHNCAYGRKGGGVDEPLKLLAFYPPCPEQAKDQ